MMQAHSTPRFGDSSSVHSRLCEWVNIFSIHIKLFLTRPPAPKLPGRGYEITSMRRSLYAIQVHCGWLAGKLPWTPYKCVAKDVRAELGQSH